MSRRFLLLPGRVNSLPTRVACIFSIVFALAFLLLAIWLVWPSNPRHGDGELLLAYITFPVSLSLVLVSMLADSYSWTFETINSIGAVLLCVLGTIQYAVGAYFVGLLCGSIYVSIHGLFNDH